MPYSERDYLAAREFREFVREEEDKIRVNADYQEYEKYVEQIESEQKRCAPAQRIKPLSFNDWRECIPAELKDAPPAVRGAAATATSCMRTLAKVAVDRLKNSELTDAELQTLGFDSEDRVLIPEAQLSIPAIVDIFNRFADREPRYVYKLHYQPIVAFLSRNKLFPSENHVALVFNHLLGINALPMPEPEPEQERPEGLNEYGVNLSIERDPEIERQKRRQQYETEIVIIDPETGQGYTEFQLDRVDSETYRRLMRIPRVYKNRPEPQR